jgi:Zn-finger nucleic acid-binding protein
MMANVELRITEILKTAFMTPEQEALVERLIYPKCGVMTLLRRHEDAGMVFNQCSQCMTVWVLTANDRVEGRDAALSRRVPSHDGLCGNGNYNERTDK